MSQGKILIIANNDVGLYSFRKELIVELLKLYEVYISLPYGEMVELLENLGCVFKDIPVDRRGINPITDAKLFLSYRKLIRQIAPRMVINYTIKPNIYGGFACCLSRVPYVINVTGLGTAFEREGILKHFVVFLYKQACRSASTVFFENENDRQVFIRSGIVNKSQTHCLNGAGVNLDTFCAREYPSGDVIRFLFMGRIMAEKGINELLKAMIRLVSEGENCRLDILGDFEEEDFIEKLSTYQCEGWLRHHGHMKNVSSFIEQCHCLVLPSWHEGMANAVLECAASARPVIATDIFGCQEAVIDDKTGFLVKQKDAECLYKAMKKFISLSYEQRKTMGLAGRHHMEEAFDRRNIVEETLKRMFSASGVGNLYRD